MTQRSFNISDIKRGDLIVIAYNNYLYPAIFDKVGIANNPNYWLISKENYEWWERRSSFIKRPKVDYANRLIDQCIVKITEESLSVGDRWAYHKQLEFLQQKGVL